MQCVVMQCECYVAMRGAHQYCDYCHSRASLAKWAARREDWIRSRRRQVVRTPLTAPSEATQTHAGERSGCGPETGRNRGN